MKKPRPKPKRFPVLWGIFFVLLGSGGWWIGKLSTVPKPNLIFIMVDTLRADYLGCYGFPGQISPAIDALAKESLLFKNCVSQAPWTKPSVASLFTSLHPQTHRVVDQDNEYWKDVSGQLKTDALPDEAVTLAEVLKEAGYTTAGFVGNPWLRAHQKFGQGFDFYADSSRMEKRIENIFHVTFQWLDQYKSDKPFFLYIHLMDVHGPYECEQSRWETFRKEKRFLAKNALTFEEVKKIPGYLRPRQSFWNDSTSQKPENWRGCYAAGVNIFDERFGKILATLRSQGYLDNSLLIFTSDHGEELYEHENWGHGGSLNFHQTQVPLLIRLPQGKKGGRAIDSVVSLIDLMPTLMEVAGAKKKDLQLQGTSLVPHIKGKKRREGGESYSEAVKQNPFEMSVRDQNYRFIHDFKTKMSGLFDLKVDPTESRNLIQKKPDIAQRYQEKLEQHRGSLLAQPTLLSTKTELTDELKEELKSLGYLQ